MTAPSAAIKNIHHPGEHIRNCRIQHGYTLRECARLTGISPAHLSDIERGNRAVTITVAFALDRLLPMLMPARQLLTWQLNRSIDRMKADLTNNVDNYLSSGGAR